MGTLSTTVENVMTTIKIPWGKYTAVHNWCRNNISEQKYYLHNKCGGDGWVLEGFSTITIRDEKKALMMILSCLD